MPRDIFRTVESKYRASARVMAFRQDGLKERGHSLGVFVAVHTSNAAGTQVVGARGAAVANPTGGTVIDAECRAQLIALMDRLRNTAGHGLIAT